jgi:hypothetical protein
MDTALVSALAALDGSMIGGMTSLTASWLSKRVEFDAEQLAHDLTRREDLYKDFIEEASKWYTHAYEHESTELANLVGLYALVGRMRIISSNRIVESADQVVRIIIETYRAPNKGLADVVELLDNDAMNPTRVQHRVPRGITRAIARTATGPSSGRPVASPLVRGVSKSTARRRP